jgi:hypothetical protein
MEACENYNHYFMASMVKWLRFLQSSLKEWL